MSQGAASARGGLGPQGATGPQGITGPALVSLPTTLNGATQAIVGLKTVSFTGELNNGNSGASANIDWTIAQKQVITLTSGTVALTMTAPPGVSNLLLRIVQDGSGGRFITSWPATIKWAGGAGAPTLSPASGAIDIVSLYWNGTNYFGVASLNFT